MLPNGTNGDNGSNLDLLANNKANNYIILQWTTFLFIDFIDRHKCYVNVKKINSSVKDFEKINILV